MVPTSATTLETPADWTRLDPEDKRQRLLGVATELFILDGLDVAMPAVANAAGVGIGSLYRVFPSKEELIAAMVVREMQRLRSEVSRAHEDEDAGAALERTIRHLVDRQATNKLLRAALAVTSDRREVRVAVGEVSLAWQELLDRARRQGSVRTDATVTDVRLVFAASAAADEIEPDGRRRMVDLLLEAMRGRTPEVPMARG